MERQRGRKTIAPLRKITQWRLFLPLFEIQEYQQRAKTRGTTCSLYIGKILRDYHQKQRSIGELQAEQTKKFEEKEEQIDIEYRLKKNKLYADIKKRGL